MDSSNGRYVITYNGEIYNFPEIRSHFVDHNFKGSSDTEILLLAIEKWGLDKALQQINGMVCVCSVGPAGENTASCP